MRRCSLLLLGACLLPSVASAEWTAFLPRSSRSGAFVELFGSYERDHGGLGPRPFLWTDAFFREKLTLYSNGYSYAPQFLQYRLSLTGALKQEDYRSSYVQPNGQRNSEGLEYEGRIFLLPEHPYNLHLFALRYEPLFKERAATQHESVQTSRGGLMRYRKKPYFLNAGYIDNSVELTQSSSEVERLNLDGQYFKESRDGKQLSLNALFSPSWFRDSLGLDGSTTDAQAGGALTTRRARVNGNLTRNTFSQSYGRAPELESRRFGGYGLASVYLPWSFRSDLSYRREDNETTLPGSVPSTRSDAGNDWRFALVHRLYESLDSNYTFQRNTRGSSRGETDARSQALDFNYTKRIPAGRLLANVNLGRGRTESTGQADVANEPHPAVSVPGSFSLLQRDAVRASVSVFLRSPVSPFESVRLVLNAHYTLTDVAGVLQVNVLTLPPQFVLPGSYDFFVTYSLIGGEFVLGTSSFGSNLSVQLFDTMLTPYVGYATVSSEVTAGVFPGSPLDSTTYTAGLLFHMGPFQAREEFQKVDWEVSPYRSVRIDVQYVDSVGRTTSVYATVSYLNKRFSQGSDSFAVPPHTDAIATATGSVRQQFFSNRMQVSTGGSYSRLSGLSDSNAYSLNASLSWTIGRLLFEAGATAYASDSRSATAYTTNRDHQYYYFKLRRDFY